MPAQLSVIVCTYNPKEEVFSRSLQSIEAANRYYGVNEIIIVDNNSSNPVKDNSYVASFLSNNPNAKVVKEEKQGLTPARIKGIKESVSDTIVFVDDDNFLHENFFEKGMQVAEKKSYIGAWSGQVLLKFEKTPEEWTRKYWGLLVHREFENDQWSNFPHLPETMPCGAGLFLRRTVAEHYLHLHDSGERNIQLDRSGNSLFSGGDNDLAACACDVGLGVGLFHEIKLDHFITKDRTTKSYLLKLAEGISASAIVFKSFRNEFASEPSVKNKIANVIRMLLKNSTDRQFYKAVLKGEETGRAMTGKNTRR